MADNVCKLRFFKFAFFYSKPTWSSINTSRLIGAKTVRDISVLRHTFEESWWLHHCRRSWNPSTMFVTCQSVKMMKCKWVFQIKSIQFTTSIERNLFLFFFVGCPRSLQEQHSWKSNASLQKEICSLHRTHPTWKDQWNKCSSWHPSIKGNLVECWAVEEQVDPLNVVLLFSCSALS